MRTARSSIDGVGGRRRSGASVSSRRSRSRRAQPQLQPVTHVASIAPGSIQGIVQDETARRSPAPWCRRSARTTAFAVTDRSGRFELRTLSPGPYLRPRALVRLRRVARPDRRGAAERARVVVHRAAARRRGVRRSTPVLAAGIGAVPMPAAPAPTPIRRRGRERRPRSTNDDHSEIAWRLRHARRGILKDVDGARRARRRRHAAGRERLRRPDVFGRVVGSPARLAVELLRRARRSPARSTC